MCVPVESAHSWRLAPAWGSVYSPLSRGSEQREPHLPGPAASFRSGVPGLLLGLWPDLTPKITALGQPQTRGSRELSAPIALER